MSETDLKKLKRAEILEIMVEQSKSVAHLRDELEHSELISKELAGMVRERDALIEKLNADKEYLKNLIKSWYQINYTQIVNISHKLYWKKQFKVYNSLVISGRPGDRVLCMRKVRAPQGKDDG